jgi:uncharacterized protein YacL
MEDKNQIKYLSSKIKEYIKLFEKKRRLNKFLSFWIKIAGAIFAGLISVLLGLSLKNRPEKLFSNIALILSTSISILNTWDAFFNHKALWIRFTVTTVKLYELDEELEYLISKQGGVLRSEELDKIHDKMKSIIEETNTNWFELRKTETKN